MPFSLIFPIKRLSKQRSNKAYAFGKAGIGKSSLLWNLPEEQTLFTEPRTPNALRAAISDNKRSRLRLGGLKV